MAVTGKTKLLREGVERDAADICARLLSRNTTSASVFVWALSIVQPMRWSEVEEKTRKEHGLHVVTSHSLSLANDNVFVLWNGIVTNKWPQKSVEYRKGSIHGVTIDTLQDDVFLEIFNFYLSDPTKYLLQHRNMAETSSRLPEMAKNYICITTPS
ncbi:hypothetical protein BJY52DRAFT_1223031 [Lactarius psammicola]|nr:hypothetical protein BJY52DRAFT_1223031 [Lactarius psammicola]